MAWGFLDWVRGRPYRADAEKLSLAKDAGDAELRAMAMRLLEDKVAYDAYQLLDKQKARARPVLEELLWRDVRFRAMVEVRGWGRPRFEVVLWILFEWKSEEGVREALVLAQSGDQALRKIAAKCLASTGEARFAGVLQKLANDGEESVRRRVGEGISHVLDCGGIEQRALADELAVALYEYMRDCALRTDRGSGKGFARELFRVDRERALRDFVPERVLSLQRNWLEDLIETLRAERVAIPGEMIKMLLAEACAEFDRVDYSPANSPSHDSLVGKLLLLVAEKEPVTARRRMEALYAHRQEQARGAAQWAREKLSPDPIRVAQRELEACGGDKGLARMRPELRHVYLAWLLITEMCNGGWLQWVANSSGAFAEPTLEALEAIGADAAGAELRKVMEILGPDGRAAGQGKRKAAIDGMMSRGGALPPDGNMWKMEIKIQKLIYDYAELRAGVFGRERD